MQAVRRARQPESPYYGLCNPSRIKRLNPESVPSPPETFGRDAASDDPIS
jgi:hypothetical protein